MDLPEYPTHRDPAMWAGYLGVNRGRVYFTHGSYSLVDIVNQMYPDPEDPRRTQILLIWGGE